MTPTEPGFYWAIWSKDKVREPIVVLFGDGRVWITGNEVEDHPRDWIFLSGPLRFPGTLPPA